MSRQQDRRSSVYPRPKSLLERSRPKTSTVAVLITLSLVIACGGGGKGASSSPTAPTAGYALDCGQCAAVTGPNRPIYENCRRTTPEEQWRSWYSELQVCADEVGPGFDNLVWWKVDSLQAGEEGPNALAVNCGDDIAFVPPPKGGTVKHEMLHHIMGVSYHPPEFDRCVPGT